MVKGNFITHLEKIEPANLLGVKSQKAVKGKFDQNFIAILNLLFAQLDHPNINNLEGNSISTSEKQAEFRPGFSNLEEKKKLLSTLLERLETILEKPATLKDEKTLLSILKDLKKELEAFTHSHQIEGLNTALVNVCLHQISNNPEINSSESPRVGLDERLPGIIQRLQEILGEKLDVQDKNNNVCSKDIPKKLNPKGNPEITQKGLINKNENENLEFMKKLLNSKELVQNGKETQLASSLPQTQEGQGKSLKTILLNPQFSPHATKEKTEVKVPLPPKEVVKTNIKTKSKDKPIITSTQPKIGIHVSPLEKADAPQGPHYLDKSNVLDQIAKGVHIQLKAGKKEATIQLEPPSLGKLHVKVGIENGVVKVHFIAAYHATKTLIEANLASLRQTLLQQGVQVGEFSVALGGQQSASSGNREGKNNSEQKEPGEKEITPIKAVEEKKPFSSTGEIDFWV